MRVLLTRAAEDAARTRVRLEALGHQVLVAPVIAIEALYATWPGGVVDAIVATSAHAFTTQHADWGPSPETKRLAPLRLVGLRTLEAARRAGYGGGAVVAANAVALAMQMSKRPLGRAIYLAGHDRKPDLETAFAVTDQAVDVIETYAARQAATAHPGAIESLSRSEIDIVLHFSRRSAELFVAHYGQSIGGGVRHHCLSDDCAEPLRAAGWAALVAARPNEDALLQLVETST